MLCEPVQILRPKELLLVWAKYHDDSFCLTESYPGFVLLICSIQETEQTVLTNLSLERYVLSHFMLLFLTVISINIIRGSGKRTGIAFGGSFLSLQQYSPQPHLLSPCFRFSLNLWLLLTIFYYSPLAVLVHRKSSIGCKGKNVPYSQCNAYFVPDLEQTQL